MRLAIPGMFLCALTFGQTFEAASVKRAVSGDRVRANMRGGPDTADPGQIMFTSDLDERLIARVRRKVLPGGWAGLAELRTL